MNNLVSNLTRRDPIPPESPDMLHPDHVGPDVSVSMDGVSMRVDLTPGPYSQADGKRLLQVNEMVRELIESRISDTAERPKRRQSVSFVEPEAES